jgi:hypothetical protein
MIDCCWWGGLVSLLQVLFTIVKGEAFEWLKVMLKSLYKKLRDIFGFLSVKEVRCLKGYGLRTSSDNRTL